MKIHNNNLNIKNFKNKTNNTIDPYVSNILKMDKNYPNTDIFVNYKGNYNKFKNILDLLYPTDRGCLYVSKLKYDEQFSIISEIISFIFGKNNYKNRQNTYLNLITGICENNLQINKEWEIFQKIGKDSIPEIRDFRFNEEDSSKVFNKHYTNQITDIMFETSVNKMRDNTNRLMMEYKIDLNSTGLEELWLPNTYNNCCYGKNPFDFYLNMIIDGFGNSDINSKLKLIKYSNSSLVLDERSKSIAFKFMKDLNNYIFKVFNSQDHMSYCDLWVYNENDDKIKKGGFLLGDIIRLGHTYPNLTGVCRHRVALGLHIFSELFDTSQKCRYFSEILDELKNIPQKDKISIDNKISEIKKLLDDNCILYLDKNNNLKEFKNFLNNFDNLENLKKVLNSNIINIKNSYNECLEKIKPINMVSVYDSNQNHTYLVGFYNDQKSIFKNGKTFIIIDPTFNIFGKINIYNQNFIKVFAQQKYLFGVDNFDTK